MPRSIWKLDLDAKREESTKKVVNSCIKALDRPPIESKIESYSKGGFMATLEFYHNEKLSWPEIIFEVMQFSQQLGTGWLVLGNIASEYNAILSKQPASNFRLSGIQWAECAISNEQKA